MSPCALCHVLALDTDAALGERALALRVAGWPLLEIAAALDTEPGLVLDALGRAIAARFGLERLTDAGQHRWIYRYLRELAIAERARSAALRNASNRRALNARFWRIHHQGGDPLAEG